MLCLNFYKFNCDFKVKKAKYVSTSVVFHSKFRNKNLYKQ